MKIIIKDRMLNLKVKTTDMNLAAIVLMFFKNKDEKQAEKEDRTVFNEGVKLGKMLCKHEVPEEKDKTSSLGSLLKHFNDPSSVTAPTHIGISMFKKDDKDDKEIKPAKRLHRKSSKKSMFITWTDNEILTIKNNLTLKIKELAVMPELSKHTMAAINTKRYAIKKKDQNNLSKDHYNLIK